MSPPKRLAQVLGEQSCPARHGQLLVHGLCTDSRRAGPGDLFLAYPGGQHDGRAYIDQAMRRGAVAVAYDPEGFAVGDDVPGVAVPALRFELGAIAERFFDSPSRSLFVVGITGTNGKTSCAYLLAQAFDRLGQRAAVIGTLGSGFLPRLCRTTHTTPDPISLHARLRKLLDDGATHVCLEVSSHALDQGRVSGVAIDAAVFTNISRDHLDYHGDLQRYAAAKAKLFDFPDLDFMVVNRDDELGRELSRRSRPKPWSYGKTDADFHPVEVHPDASGLGVVIGSPAGVLRVRSHLIGTINVPNLLAVAAVVFACGHSPAQISTALRDIGPVPGRMELFAGLDSRPRVVVDYAHTPDALQRALESMREHCRGRLWCVFGCGGDRDRGKRPMMGEIADALADEIVLTDDNPRFEEPARIVAEIQGGMRRRGRVMHDRVEAIQWAVAQATGQDWILVAGKGHETEQQVGAKTIPLDDRRVVQDCLLAA